MYCTYTRTRVVRAGVIAASQTSLVCGISFGLPLVPLEAMKKQGTAGTAPDLPLSECQTTLERTAWCEDIFFGMHGNLVNVWTDRIVCL